jgi:hypothetical protein
MDDDHLGLFPDSQQSYKNGFLALRPSGHNLGNLLQAALGDDFPGPGHPLSGRNQGNDFINLWAGLKLPKGMGQNGQGSQGDKGFGLFGSHSSSLARGRDQGHYPQGRFPPCHPIMGKSYGADLATPVRAMGREVVRTRYKENPGWISTLGSPVPAWKAVSISD